MDRLETLHQRYAKALFDFAGEDSNTGKIMQELETLADIIHSNREISQALRHPGISKDEKIRVLEEICEKGKPGKGFMNFLKVLTRKNRLNLINGILLRYRDYYDKERKRARVFVRSAVKLNQSQIDKLLKRLCQLLKEEVTLEVKIDPSLIGGLFLKIHGRIYDASVVRALLDINKRLAL